MYLNIGIPAAWQAVVIWVGVNDIDNDFINSFVIWPLEIATSLLLIISAVVLLIALVRIRKYYKGSEGQLNQMSLLVHAAVFGLYGVTKTWMFIRKDIQDSVTSQSFIAKLASTFSFAVQILMTYVMIKLSSK